MNITFPISTGARQISSMKSRDVSFFKMTGPVSLSKTFRPRRGPLQSNWIIMARHLLVWLLVSCEVNEWPPGRFTKSGCRLCSERLTKGCHLLFVKVQHEIFPATQIGSSILGVKNFESYLWEYLPWNLWFVFVVSLAFLRFNAFRCCRCSVESWTLQTAPTNS